MTHRHPQSEKFCIEGGPSIHLFLEEIPSEGKSVDKSPASGYFFSVEKVEMRPRRGLRPSDLIHGKRRPPDS